MTVKCSAGEVMDSSILGAPHFAVFEMWDPAGSNGRGVRSSKS